MECLDLTGADVAPYRKSAHTDGLSRCVCRERLLLMGHLTEYRQFAF